MVPAFKGLRFSNRVSEWAYEILESKEGAGGHTDSRQGVLRGPVPGAQTGLLTALSRHHLPRPSLTLEGLQAGNPGGRGEPGLKVPRQLAPPARRPPQGWLGFANAWLHWRPSPLASRLCLGHCRQSAQRGGAGPVCQGPWLPSHPGQPTGGFTVSVPPSHGPTPALPCQPYNPCPGLYRQ